MSQENVLEMAQRHVREGEKHVARQREIVGLKHSGQEHALLSQSLLRTFEATLALHRDHLGRLLRAQS